MLPGKEGEYGPVGRTDAARGTAIVQHALLVRRIRQGCVIIVSAIAFFAVQDTLAWPALLPRLYLVKALNLAWVGLALVLLKRADTDARAVVAGLVAYAAGCFGSALSSAITHDSGNTVALCIALAFGAATLLPWGVWAQAAAAGIAFGAALLNAWIVGGAYQGDDYPLGALAVALAASVYIAREGERQRRALAWENDERLRAERKLEAGVAELEDLWNNTPCGYHSVDANGVFLRINDTELAWLGYTREELIGKRRVPDVLTPASRKAFGENFSLLKTRGWIRDVEAELLCKDGSAFPVVVSASAVVDSAGNFVMSRTSMVDNSARKQFERQKADFFATVAHDIRNPVSTLLGGVEILGDQESLDEQAKEILAVVARSATLLSTLVNDYLDYAKIEAGAIHLSPRAVALAPLLSRICGDMRYEAERRGIEVSLDLAPEVGEVHADAMALQRIFSNLLGNALKFTPADGRIRVSAERRDGEVVVSVADTGPGIAPADIPQLFARYRQTETGRRVVGTGLGLYVVKSLVEALDGRVEVESELERGTTFRVHLAVLPARSEAA